MSKLSHRQLKKKHDSKPLADVVSAVLDPKHRDLGSTTAIALMRAARRAAGQTA